MLQISHDALLTVALVGFSALFDVEVVDGLAPYSRTTTNIANMLVLLMAWHPVDRSSSDSIWTLNALKGWNLIMHCWQLMQYWTVYSHVELFIHMYIYFCLNHYWIILLIWHLYLTLKRYMDGTVIPTCCQPWSRWWPVYEKGQFMICS